jgi:hypothetical protein
LEIKGFAIQVLLQILLQTRRNERAPIVVLDIVGDIALECALTVLGKGGEGHGRWP